jgi:hypothetical protein
MAGIGQDIREQELRKRVHDSASDGRCNGKSIEALDG